MAETKLKELGFNEFKPLTIEEKLKAPQEYIWFFEEFEKFIELGKDKGFYSDYYIKIRNYELMYEDVDNGEKMKRTIPCVSVIELEKDTENEKIIGVNGFFQFLKKQIMTMPQDFDACINLFNEHEKEMEIIRQECMGKHYKSLRQMSMVDESNEEKKKMEIC